MTLPDPKMNSASPDAPPSSQQRKDQQEFQVLDLAFLGSLLPGIIHNFATPLSGVLGATQLLEKRASTLEELVREAQSMGEAERTELCHQVERNRTNIDILSRNARHLADLLQVLVQRINRCNSTSREFFSLNELVQSELRFLEAHLNFKHKVKKQVDLDPQLQTAGLVYGHVAAVIEEFVVSTLSLHDLSKGTMQMEFKTVDNRQSVSLEITAHFADSGTTAPREPLAGYFARLRANGWAVEHQFEPGLRQLKLTLARTPAPA